jgi:hypothetical protein
MKRLVLLSVGALMLAATVFAPVAMAQEGVLNFTSVTLGTGGTVDVSGTFQCPEGDQYSVFAEVRQTTGNRPYNSGTGNYPNSVLATCSGEPDAFTFQVIGVKPYKKGTALVSGGFQVCDSETGFCSFGRTPFEEFRVR